MKRDIIFISGWGTNEEIWKSLKNSLDNLNSDFKYHYLSWSKYIKDNSDFLEGNYDNPIIIGWSLGTIVGLKLALQYPSRISKLILLSPTARMLKDIDYDGAHLKILESMIGKIKTNPNQILKECARNYSSDNNEEFQEIFLRQAFQYSVIELCDGLDFLRDADIKSDIKKLNLPTLIIHGRKDKIIPLSQGEYINSNIQNSKLKILDAGHDLLISRASEISKEVREFICA